MEQTKARVWNGKIVAQVPYEEKNKITGCRTVMGYKFVRHQTDRGEVPYWELPYSPITAKLFHEDFDNVQFLDNGELEELYKKYKNALEAKTETDLPHTLPGLKATNPRTGEPLQPWLHQRQAYYFGMNLPGVMLAFDMGTGKSLTAVSLTVNTDHDMVCILCPKSVMPVWSREFEYAENYEDMLFYVATGARSVKNKASELARQIRVAKAKNKKFIAVVNYDIAWRDEMKKTLLGYDWDVLILDEIQRIKNPSNTAKASKFASKLAEQSKKRLGLTGTPMPHSPLDIFAQYRALDPAIFGTNYHRFKMRYAYMGGFNGKEVVGFKNQEELSEKFHSIAIQASKSVLNLPEAMHTYRSFTLTKKARQIYDSLDKQLYAEIEQGSISPANAMVKVLRLQQLTSGHQVLDDNKEIVQMDTGKRDLLYDLLQDFPQDEPIVVFCRFQQDLMNIQRCAEKIGRPCSELSGRANQLEEWQNGNSTILAVQIRSGGVGIDLTRAAYCIYYSIGHSLGDYLQSLDRIHRHGQQRSVTYYHLIAEKTIDEKVYRALQQKKEVIDAILNMEV